MTTGIEAFFEEQDAEDDKVIELGENAPEVISDTPEVKDEPEVEKVEKAEEEDKPSLPQEPDYKSTIHELKDQLASVTQLLRETTQQVNILKGQSQVVKNVLTESGHIDENTPAPAAEEVAVSEDRYEALQLISEATKLNPKYEHFDEVCTQDNFDRTVMALAKIAVKEEGGTLTGQMSRMTNYIWSLPNPYKFVYEVVTQNDPRYTKPSQTVQAPKEKEKAPTSLSAVPGGSGSKGEGWTAAKIDSLPEDQLHTVPADIYEAYMKNQLK